MPFGIQFDGRAHSLSVDRHGEYELKIRQDRDGKAYRTISHIPVVRGFYFLFTTIYNFALKLLKENKPMLLLFVGLAAYSIFGPRFASGASTGFFWDNFISIIVWLMIILFVYAARKHHSIEHKLISTYQKGLEPTLENVKAQPSHNPRCGGVLLAWVLILHPLLRVFTSLDGFALTFVLVLLGYEGLMLANMQNPLGKLFYLPGYLLQLLATSRKLSDEDIEKFRKPFAVFVIEEVKYIRQHEDPDATGYYDYN